jgi:hypothetical protein
MNEKVKKAQTVVKDILQEFEPSKGHFVAGTKEFLLAMRSVIDAQINLLDRATRKDSKSDQQGGA